MPRRRIDCAADIRREMERKNEWERRNLTGGRKVLAELEALDKEYVTPESELYGMFIEDASCLVRKYTAIDDITKNPSGLEGPLRIESILDENAEVRMTSDGWELDRHRTPEEIAELEAKFEAARLKKKERGGE